MKTCASCQGKGTFKQGVFGNLFCACPAGERARIVASCQDVRGIVDVDTVNVKREDLAAAVEHLWFIMGHVEALGISAEETGRIAKLLHDYVPEVGQ